MTFSHKTPFAIGASALLLLTGALPSAAQTPHDLRDLVGARAGQAEGEVERRGYSNAGGRQGGDSSLTYWSRGDDCVQITTRDGRYAAIDSTSASNCRRGSSGSDASAVLAGVAIVGLAAAIAAHNRHHDHDEADHDEEYSRGYQDALYGSTYDRHDSEAYHSGYTAGETERGNRRASNSGYMRRAPAPAQAACSRRADDYQNAPSGSSTPITFDQSGDRYTMTMATGQYRSVCTVTGSGRIIDIQPY